MAGYIDQLKRILREHHCTYLKPGKGDHEIWITPGGKKFTVDHGIKSRHTVNGILKEAGIQVKI